MDRRSFLRKAPWGAAAAVTVVTVGAGPTGPVEAVEALGDPWYRVDYAEYRMMGEGQQGELHEWLAANGLPSDPNRWASVDFWPGFAQVLWLEPDESMDRYAWSADGGLGCRTTGLRNVDPPRFAATAMGI